MGDWSDDPQFKEFAEQVLRDTVPKIAGSAYVISVAPVKGGTADVKMAVEIGFAILMDKPLIVLAPKGRTVADRLLRIADHVIESDMDTESGRKTTLAKLKAAMKQ
jgi:nucleoside 2-deoxyribosyltransferase